jgi:hypothetical protein
MSRTATKLGEGMIFFRFHATFTQILYILSGSLRERSPRGALRQWVIRCLPVTSPRGGAGFPFADDPAAPRFRGEKRNILYKERVTVPFASLAKSVGTSQCPSRQRACPPENAPFPLG